MTNRVIHIVSIGKHDPFTLLNEKKGKGREGKRRKGREEREGKGREEKEGKGREGRKEEEIKPNLTLREEEF
jgi:hypothetical protein